MEGVADQVETTPTPTQPTVAAEESNTEEMEQDATPTGSDCPAAEPEASAEGDSAEKPDTAAAESVGSHEEPAPGTESE